MTDALRLDGWKPATPDLSRYAQTPLKHTEKGRLPINSREVILDKVATLTGTKITRWCRYEESELTRAYLRLSELQGVRNKSAYFIWLLTHQ